MLRLASGISIWTRSPRGDTWGCFIAIITTCNDSDAPDDITMKEVETLGVNPNHDDCGSPRMRPWFVFI